MPVHSKPPKGSRSTGTASSAAGRARRPATRKPAANRGRNVGRNTDPGTPRKVGAFTPDIIHFGPRPPIARPVRGTRRV